MALIRTIEDGVDISLMLREIAENQLLWTLKTGRQQRIQCQRETQTIFLRSPRKPIPNGLTSNDVHSSRATPIADEFPQVMAWVTAFVERTGGEIGRVMLVRIQPQGRVYEHRDRGDYYAVRQRFHLILKAEAGCILWCHGESIHLSPGQLLWFDNKEPYSETNSCDEWSVRLIIDVLPAVRAPVSGSPTQHFAMMRSGIDVSAMRQELDEQPELWDLSTSRQSSIRVQRETSNIHLRNAVKPIPEGISGTDWHLSKRTRVADRCPVIYRFVESFAAEMNASLSRLTVVRLNPNGRVYPHIDAGEYYRVRDRYHLVVQSPDGSDMSCGDERVVFREGELWWFDNKAPHEAFNNSSQGRIHVIFDLLPSKPLPPVW